MESTSDEEGRRGGGEKGRETGTGDSAFNWTCAFLPDLPLRPTTPSVGASDLSAGEEIKERERDGGTGRERKEQAL